MTKAAPQAPTSTFLGYTVVLPPAPKGGRAVAQRPTIEMAPVLDALIADESIASFGWDQRQGDDGDGPFEAVNFWVSTVWDEPGLRASPMEITTADLEHTDHWLLNGDEAEEDERYDAGRVARVRALAAALGSGEFDESLALHFGRGVEVEFRRVGGAEGGWFEVAPYEY